MLKNRLSVIYALFLPAFFSVIFSGCLLGDDIETIRSRVEITVPGGTLAAKLAWLESNVRSGGRYLIEVTADESLNPTKLYYGGENNNITITIRGVSVNRIISLSSNGSMFTVGDSNNVTVTLILDNNITLQGHSDNTASLVRVSYGGTLIMNNGSTITGNTYLNGSAYGGGVSVGSNGTFIMIGGTISMNTASYGGGVSVFDGTFIKTGGTIYGYSASEIINGNAVKDDSGEIQSGKGHAVYVTGNGVARQRDTTAGPDVNLSFDGTADPPEFDGGWEFVAGSLAWKLQQLQDSMQEGGSYIIEVDDDESIEPFILSPGFSITNITITLKGIDANRTISLSSYGSMFTVYNGVTLVLDNNITLRGRGSNNASLVTVDGGTLIMNAGSAITGNTLSPYYSSGGGVYVSGTFTMNGGTISGNSVSFSADVVIAATVPIPSGGGVYVSGTFTMNGGTISGNTAAEGGGVYVGGGTFTMSGGTISGNTASADYNAYGASGGGVYVRHRTTFVKTGGTIYGNNGGGSSNMVRDSSGVAQYDSGHAVYASNGNDPKRRETTAGPGVNLALDGSDGTFSGEWED